MLLEANSVNQRINDGWNTDVDTSWLVRGEGVLVEQVPFYRACFGKTRLHCDVYGIRG